MSKYNHIKYDMRSGFVRSRFMRGPNIIDASFAVINENEKISLLNILRF